MRRIIVRTLVGLAALAVLVALTGVTGWLLVWPQTTPPDQADVVLVLSGGTGERVTTGARLARAGVAPVLVLSDGGNPASPRALGCQQRFPGVRVVCLTPRTPTTQGEARAFAELAAREGWRSVALVTSTYHVRRAELLLGRCFPGAVHAVGAPPADVRGHEIVPLALHEGVGVLAALTVQRDC
jgi:uncharacterized SAM-binding protein YcdF (DUF218 family)